MIRCFLHDRVLKNPVVLIPSKEKEKFLNAFPYDLMKMSSQ